MIRKQILILFFLLAGVSILPAQIEMNFAAGVMRIHQTGLIIVYPTFNNNYYPVHKVNVDRNLTVFGATMTAYRALNYPVLSHSGFTYGPQLGIGFNYVKHSDQDIDIKYIVNSSSGYFAHHFGIFRMPAGFSLRYGKFKESFMISGLSITGGTEISYLRIPDESAFSTLPFVEIGGVSKSIGMQLVFYPISFRSYYDSNLGRVDRLKSRFFRFEISWHFQD